MDAYSALLERKAMSAPPTGMTRTEPLTDGLFEFQQRIVDWALAKGRAAIFADCGLGKTIMQLEWARHIPGDVLILTPLAVAQQTAAEALKFGLDATVSRDGTVTSGTTITNYQQLHKFDVSQFTGIVLDESSILKAYDGKTRTAIIDAALSVPYRLACTATPAPNDHMELGNHAEFLGAMSRVEMLSTFFVHDGGDTAKWRLKGHATDDFWRWVATWAVALQTPADMGYDAGGFDLPRMRLVEHLAHSDFAQESMLFPVALSLNEQRRARKASMADRVRIVADLANNSDEQWLIWCDLNAEGDALTAAIDGAIQVSGANDDDTKAERMLGFTAGKYRVLVTKPQIAGFGMNWQNCHNMAFAGLTHSYERFYQAVRRCWRFGQTEEVNVNVVLSEPERPVLTSIRRKEADAMKMASAMVEHMCSMEDWGGMNASQEEYVEDKHGGASWEMNRGDCVTGVRAMPDDSVHYTVFSPPFASLYTYSASVRDMGNCASHSEFFEQFRFLVKDLFRVTMPGRLLSFHCMDLPASKTRDGFIGIHDFRGELVREFVDAGWILHSQVVIWKDPVTAMQRTKALGLLHKQIKKDSCMSRQGLPDYLVTMRKPGDNPERVGHTNETFPVELWQKYASPVWMDIKPNETLQFRSAREDKDERHICPLQLDVIRRALKLWSNPGDTVLSPFAGIGSEGFVALEEGRKFIGYELKASYFEQACRNLDRAETGGQVDLFA
jgi:superfamily II DNA or RNA helicase